jgi:hypothetical protein
MNRYWFDQKVWEACKIAEKWWALRTPGIIKESDKVIEKWREEKEQKERWKVMVI